jgi:hypothetical protein
MGVVCKSSKMFSYLTPTVLILSPSEAKAVARYRKGIDVFPADKN